MCTSAFIAETHRQCAREPRTPSHADPLASVAAICSSPVRSVVMLCKASGPDAWPSMKYSSPGNTERCASERAVIGSMWLALWVETTVSAEFVRVRSVRLVLNHVHHDSPTGLKATP